MCTFMITLNERYMRKEYKRMSKTHKGDMLDKNEGCDFIYSVFKVLYFIKKHFFNKSHVN